jgi:site-specific DNA-cytosine methylase
MQRPVTAEASNEPARKQTVRPEFADQGISNSRGDTQILTGEPYNLTREGQWAAKHPIAGTLMYGVSNLVGGAEGFINTGEAALRALATGEKMNPHDIHAAPIAQAFRTGAAEGFRREAQEEHPRISSAIGIDSNDGRYTFGEKAMDFLTGVGADAVSSSISMATGGPLSTALMGGSAANQALYETSQDQNTTARQAAALATANGIAEAFFEHFSIERLMHFQNPTSTAQAVRTALAQAGVEASEEMATEIANTVSDIAIRRGNSERGREYQERLTNGENPNSAARNTAMSAVTQVLLSGLGGALSGGLHTGMAMYGNTLSNGMDLRRDIRNGITLEDIAGSIDTSTAEGQRVQNLANDIAQREASGTMASDTELGYLSNAIANAAEVAEQNEAKAVARQTAPAENVASETTPQESIPERQAVTQMMNDVAAETAKDTGEAFRNANYYNSQRMTAGERIFNAEMAEDMASTFGEEGQKAFSALPAEEGVKAYREWAAHYNNMRFGMPIREGMSTTLSPEQISAAMRAGALDANRAYPQDTMKAVNRAVNKISVNGVNAGNTDLSGIDYKSLTPQQRLRVDYTSTFVTKGLGMDVRYVKSEAVDGKYKGMNGSFQVINGRPTITLDVNAGMNRESDWTGDITDIKSMLPVISHETTHFLEQYNPKLYKELSNTVLTALQNNGTYSKGMTINSIIEAERQRLNDTIKDENGKPVQHTQDDAIHELVARACEDMLSGDKKALDAFNSLDANTKQTLWDHVKQVFDNIREFFAQMLSSYKSDSAEARAIRQNMEEFEKIRDMWSKALNGESGNVNAADRTALHDAGISISDDGNVAHMEYSVRYTWVSEEQQAKAVAALQKSLGISKKKAQAFVQSEMSLTNLIMSPGNIARMDYDPDQRYSAIKKNSDYPQGTVDFNNNCRKRVPFTEVFNRLQERNPNRVFTAEDLEIIRQEMIKHKVPVACALCYVEERRQRLGEIAQGFVDLYKNDALLDNFSGKKEFDKIKAALDKTEGDDYQPNIYDLITYDGLKKLTASHPGIAEAFKIFNNARGMQSGRLVEGRAEYKRELLKYTPAQVKRINDLGGLRVFSYSDFEAVNLLDLVQIIQDAAVKGIKIQAYTKVPAFAKVVRNTGIKLNRSLIAHGTGVRYENGQAVLDLDPVEGIDINDPDFFDSTDDRDIGNILVGMSDEQIRLAMASDFVDYIIPFHTSLPGTILKAKGIDHWTNYKLTQNERVKATGNKAKNVNIYTDVLQAAEKEGKPIRTKKQFVNKFLEVCKERNLIPRFSQFLNVDKDGNYVYTEGYHKFLIDFKLFDKNGRIVEQQAVRPEFDDAYNTKLMEDFANGVGSTAISNEMYNDVVNALNEQSSGEKVQYSTRDIEGAADSEDRPDVIRQGSDKDIQFSTRIADKNLDNRLRVNMATFFSGTGTVDFALRNIVRHEFAVENDAKIAAVYRANNGDNIYVDDVRNVNINPHKGKVEYFHASPVCKSYSNANNDMGETPLDIETARATADAIRNLGPKVVTVENVARYRNSEAVKIIEEALEESGYDYDVKVYSATDFGGATIRKRMFIRAVKDGVLPKVDVSEQAQSWYSVVEDLIPELPEAKLSNYMEERLEPSGIDIDNLDQPVFVLGGEKSGKLTYATADKPAPTLLAKSTEAKILMPDGRVLRATPRVMARIQGLPDGFDLMEKEQGITNAYKIVGNGVPVQLTQGIVGPLLEENLIRQKSEATGVQYSMRDSSGNELTEAQAEYFKDSKVRDENGNLLRVYHGTNSEFYEFDRNRIGAHGSYEGAGFNFTPSSTRAGGYKGIGGGEGRVMEGYLNITNPLSAEKKTMTVRQLAKLIENIDPTGDDLISNYAQDTRDYGRPSFVRREALYTARQMMNYHDSDVDIYSDLSASGASANAIIDAFKNLGYDGLIHYDGNGKINTLIAFDSNQFKNIDNENPTNSADIRYSTRDSQGKELTEAQQRYFADSKVRNDDGSLKVMYHGTERGGFTVFDPAESDDGISLFFTDYSENAREYSGSYDEITPDRRMSESELFDMIENITEGDFQLSRTADGYAIEEYTLDDEGDFTYKLKKSFKTLKEAQAYAYEEFVKEGRKGGYGTIPGNYAVYLNLQDPLVVDAQDSSWREIPYWENDDGELEPATTREIAEDAKEQGYDGVIINNVLDNGQYAERQGVEANIAIAFSSNQVKSVYNENPTENNDIRYSSRMQELDAEYQEALDARNEDWQLMLVDQAAYEAGYTTTAYHGSPFTDINVFNTRSQVTKKTPMQLLFGTHFTQSLDYAKLYAQKAKNSKGTSRMTTKTGRVYKTYLDLGKSLDLRTPANITPGTDEYKLYEDAPAKYKKKYPPYTFSKYDTEQGLGSGQYITKATIENVLQAMSPKDATDFLVNHGYNSVLYDANYATPTTGNNRFTRDPSIIMLDPERIKSGDPVTYDDNGNVIPLSERFNSENEDIRYSQRNVDMSETLEEFMEKMDNRFLDRLADLDGEENAQIRQDLEDAYRANLEWAISEMQKRMDKAVGAEKKNAKKRLDALRARKNQRIDDIISEFREKRSEERLKRRTRKAQQELLRRARRIAKMKGDPGFRAQVDALIGDLDLVAVGIREDTQKKLQELDEQVKAQSELDPDYAKYEAPKYAELIGRLRKKHIKQMSIDDIVRLTEAIVALEHSKRTADREIGKTKGATFGHYGKVAVRQLGNTKGINHGNEIGAQLSKYKLNMLNPVRAFSLIDGYQRDGVFTYFGNQLNEGQTKAAEFRMKVEKMFHDIDQNRKLVDNFAKQDIEIDTLEGKKKISKGMRIALYLHLQNPDNVKHIAFGGITIPNEKLYSRGKYAEAYAAGETVHLSEWEAGALGESVFTAANRKDDAAAAAAIRKITDQMTPEELEYARIAKKFFNETTKDAINEVSLALNGYEKAIVDDYFPISTDRNYLKSDYSGLVKDGTLEGMGMLKERSGSRLPIHLEDVSQVVLRQMNNTALYYGLAIPIRNFERFYNYTGGERLDRSVKSSVGKTWGKSALDYIDNVLSDLQFGRQTQRSVTDTLKSIYAGTTLNLNLGVAIKQSASYPFAASVIGWGPLAKAARHVVSKADREYMDSITPWGYMRRTGFSGTEMGEVAMQRTGIDNNRTIQRVKTALDLIRQVDVRTTEVLFFACEEYVKDKYPDLEVRGSEYNRRLADIYNETLQRTQPSYDVMQRNEYLRKQNDIAKIFGAFKTQTFNMGGEVIDAWSRWRAYSEYAKKDISYVNAKKEAGKAFGNTVAATIVAQGMLVILSAAANAALHRMRDYRDEKGEVTPESIAKKILHDFGTSFAGMTMGGSEAQDFALALLGDGKWYDIDYPGLTLVNDFASAAVDFRKAASKAVETGDMGDIDKASAKMANLIMQMFKLQGVPAQNMYNIANAIYLWGTDIKNGEAGTFNAGSGLFGLQDTSPTKEQYAKQAIDAYRKGDIAKGDRAAKRTSGAAIKQEMGGKQDDAVRFLKENDLGDTVNRKLWEKAGWKLKTYNKNMK